MVFFGYGCCPRRNAAGVLKEETGDEIHIVSEGDVVMITSASCISGTTRLILRTPIRAKKVRGAWRLLRRHEKPDFKNREATGGRGLRPGADGVYAGADRAGDPDGCAGHPDERAPRKRRGNDLAGKQYVRGIRLYVRYYQAHGGTTVSDFDGRLTKNKVGIRFMRQAYKDPVNSVDGSWRMIYVGPNGQLIGSLKSRPLNAGRTKRRKRWIWIQLQRGAIADGK